MSNILLTGSSSGLGKCIYDSLVGKGHRVFGYSLKGGSDVCFPIFGEEINNSTIDVLINNAGINIINWLEDVTDHEWEKVMDTNAKGIFKMTQALLPKLIASKGTVLNITSNAAHMPMTCSLAYNASKAAAEIMTKQLARELTKKYGITVFGVAPNKLKGTDMSDSIDDQVVRTRGWTKEYAQKYQIDGLLTKEETPPWVVAEFIAFLLDNKENHKYLSGCIIPYGL